MTALAATFFLRQRGPLLVAAALLALAPRAAWAAGSPSAQAREVGTLTVDELDELAALAGLSQTSWQSSLETKLGVGWDSNLLLSNVTRVASGFSRARVEGLLWRPARAAQPWELVAFLNADYRKMFSAQELPHDTQAFGRAEARWRPVPALRLSLLAQGYYLDSVLDLSTESERLSTPLRNSGSIAGTAARWDLGARTWIEAQASINRSDFFQIPEDFRERRLGVLAGWQSADGTLKLGAGARQRDRRYRERTLTTLGGRPLAGTQLRYRAPELELTAERTAAWHGTWRFAGAVSGARNDDNGSGYFNYRLGRALATLGWTRAPWEVEASLGTSRYRWDAQVAGIGLDPPLRRRTDDTLTLQVNRRLNERWFVFTELEREWVWSNDPTAGYTLTMCSLGLGAKL